ncbi:YodC family protein [Aquimarina aggregata]|uniref:YodC family protein n=1 Tax=Aquimarina aggregata TaxID=1642818 RepID=UPI002492B7EC|nr:DUF2158 domain-containing protein [Aquimarina aggregata]
MKEKLKKGDLVRLKSGGPKMTVYNFDSYGNVNVTWFDNNNDQKYSDFIPEILEMVEC